MKSNKEAQEDRKKSYNVRFGRVNKLKNMGKDKVINECRNLEIELLEQKRQRKEEILKHKWNYEKIKEVRKEFNEVKMDKITEEIKQENPFTQTEYKSITLCMRVKMSEIKQLEDGETIEVKIKGTKFLIKQSDGK